MNRRPSLLAQDPDARIVRWGWVFWFSWLLVGGALNFGDWRSGVLGLGAILAAPFWALWLLWPLYRGARWAAQRLAQGRGGDWHGRHYSFDDRQIRIVFDGDAAWFAAADVFDALGTPAAARDVARVRQIVGRDGLDTAPGSSLLCFSERGLAAWLDRRTDRTATQFARWVETQVLAPYRRRRELEQGTPPAAP